MASSNAIKKREAKRRGLRNPVFDDNDAGSSDSIQSLLDNDSNVVNYQNNQVLFGLESKIYRVQDLLPGVLPNAQSVKIVDFSH